MSGVDISSVILDIAAISVPLIGIVAKLELNKFLAAHGDQADQAYLDNIIDQAAQLGLNQVQQKVGAKPVIVDLHNEVVDKALSFVLAQAEAEKTRLGFSNADIAQMITARLDLAGGTVAIAGNPSAKPPLVVANYAPPAPPTPSKGASP
jgi:hypothetical protein